MNQTQVTKELRYRHSRASGSGGQHVNKVATRVELLLDLQQTQAFKPEELLIIKKKLKTRINKEQILILSAQKSRSQAVNKKTVTKRFFTLIARALEPEKERKGPPQLKANPQKRRKDKIYLSEKKAMRRKVVI